ncbi:MAG: carboxypeptidase-like regulatory domain-containing protein [Fibrobacter sp.]|nr:carboxypeptidase-like regulatory domain-containing protein [Fibrobacter sp.]
MKKLTLCAAALVAIVMTGCEKTGTIEGVVLDPFTGKAVEMPTVWMDSTIYGTQNPKYPYKGELMQGKFKFEKVPVGEYRIKARRSKYVLGQQTIATTEKEPNLNVTLFEYSDQVKPGMYKTGTTEGPEKIENEWVIWSATCTDASVAGYRLVFPQDPNAGKVPGKADKKKGKKDKAKDKIKLVPLPAPRVMDGNLDVLYVNASSVTSPLVATSYPAVEGAVADHSDCKGFGADEKNGLFVDKAKGTALTVEYKAENLFEIKSSLPKGKQIIQLSQDGKTLQTYYFEVK